MRMLSWSARGRMEVSILSGICCDERNLGNVMRKYFVRERETGEVAAAKYLRQEKSKVRKI